jgi:hypothetical protein
VGGRVAAAVAVVAALAAQPALAAPPAPAAPRALETVLQDDALLLHRPPEQVRATVAQLAAMGVDRVRLTASWSSLAPAADTEARPEDFDATDPAAYEQARFAALDLAVRELRAAGIRVLLEAGFWAPRWAATTTDGPRARQDVDPAAFADFSAMLARRYDGTFVPPVALTAPLPSRDASLLDALLGRPAPAARPDLPAGGPLPAVDELSLWNEPNHPAFLTPTWARRAGRWQPVTPHVYRAMATQAHAAVKAVRPDLQVLVGNTSSTGGTGGGAPVPPLRFLRELACVDRDLRPLRSAACAGFRPVPGDGWAHHPYGTTQDPRFRAGSRQVDAAHLGDLRRLRALLGRLVERGRLAPGLRGVHVTELGWETLDGGAPSGVDQEHQARYLTWAEFEAASVPGVRTFAQFLLRDVPPAATRQSASVRRPYGQFASGLERADGTPKRAAAAFRAGLFAQDAGRGRTLLWLRLRGRGAGVDATLQRRAAGGSWTVARRVIADGHGATTVVVPAGPPGTRWRALLAGPGGPPSTPAVPVVRRPG